MTDREKALEEHAHFYVGESYIRDTVALLKTQDEVVARLFEIQMRSRLALAEYCRAQLAMAGINV